MWQRGVSIIEDAYLNLMFVPGKKKAGRGKLVDTAPFKSKNIKILCKCMRPQKSTKKIGRDGIDTL